MSNITKKIVATITALTVSVWLVGPGTAEALTTAELQAQIDALLAQIATLQAQIAGSGGTVSTSACSGVTSFTRNLTLGSSGSDVKCLQGILNQAADTQVSASGVGSAGNETMYFGAKTKAAVVKFQTKNAIAPAAGFVGPITRAKLNTMIGSTPSPSPSPSPTETPLPTASGLTIAVASDNPAAGTIISDGTQNVAGSQALIPALKLNFSTPAGSSAKVTTLKLKRLGVSTDTDIPNAYLYEGNTKLAEMTSFTSGVLTFTDAAGLFTVSGSKAITVKFDLEKNSSSGKTIGLGVNASADVVTDATAVNGTFPINGNLMTIATVTDFGRLQMTTSTNAATVDPGTNGFEAFRFTLTSSNQKIDVYSLKFRQIGSIATGDIANVKLSAGGTQLGSTIASLTSDGYVTFDLSAAPYQIPSGTTKTFSLTIDVVKGSTRTIQFSLSKSTDLVVKDNNYAVNVAPDAGTIGSWSAQDSQAVTVNSGNITISRRTDSPSGNIALSKTNVTLAKFDAKATGENVKVTSLVYRISAGTAWEDLKNAQVLIDGVQRGTTQVTVASDTDYTITTNYTFPAGETKTIEIRADIVAASASGAALAANDTLTALLVASTSVVNAERQVSLTNFAFPSADQNGNSLTVSASALSSEKNISVGNIQAVYGSTNVVLGSYVITAGAAEGIDVNKFVFQDSTTGDATATAADTASLGGAFTNLKLYKGATQLGSTLIPNTSDAAGTDYTFNLSPTLSLAAGESVVVDLKGDVLASGVVVWSNGDESSLLTVEGSGKVTGNTVTDSDGAGGQTISLSTAGDIALAKDSSSPGTKMVSLGDTDVVLGVWRVRQVNSVESLTLTQAYVFNGTSSATSSSNIKNLKLTCGSDVFGETRSALVPNSAASGYYATFNGSCTIPAGGYKLLTLKGDLVSYSSGAYPTGGTIVSGGDWAQFYMELPASITGVSTDYIIASGAGGAYASSTNSSSSASRVYPYRTKLAASIACNSSCTKSRSSSDKIATLTLTGSASADAQFRANLAQADDETTNGWLWASNTPAGAAATDWAAPLMGLTLTASSGSKVDGSNSIYMTATASDTAATSTWMAQVYGNTAPYSKLSMWIMPSTSTAGEIFWSAIGNATDTQTIDAWASSTATTALAALTPDTWNFVTVDVPAAVVAADDTVTIVGVKYWIEAGSDIQVAVDAIRAYNDSINIDISGNTSGSATSTAFTLKKTDGTQIATGYLSTNGTVTLIPSTGSETGNEAVIEAGSTGMTLELIANTQTLMNDDTTSNESLGLSLDFGDQDNAGDFRWYDQAVDPTNPITWLYGSTPISITNNY